MNSDNIIVIKDIVTENSGEIITFSANESAKENLMDSFIYKISSDGKVIILNPINENESKFESKRSAITNLDRRHVLANELINNSFEDIPTEITEKELEDISEYAKDKIIKGKGYSKMYPFSVEMSDEGSLNVILLMYNGSEESLELTKFPFKLKDASGNVIICDLIDINKTISADKIAICNLVISKDKLIETKIDLSKWEITFEMN